MFIRNTETGPINIQDLMIICFRGPKMAMVDRRCNKDREDARCAGADELAALPAMRWPRRRLRFHSSVQPFRVGSNCVEIWQALKAGYAPPDAATQPDSWWLLWCGEDRLTQFRSLPAEESMRAVISPVPASNCWLLIQGMTLRRSAWHC